MGIDWHLKKYESSEKNTTTYFSGLNCLQTGNNYVDSSEADAVTYTLQTARASLWTVCDSPIYNIC